MTPDLTPRAGLALPPVIGHRGAASLAPENTLAGLRAASAVGVRMVEFDAKLTADGVPVLMHDDTLGRTTDGAGPVRARSAADLSRLDAGGWFGEGYRGERVPTLAQALQTCLDLGLAANVEIKPCPGRAADTAAAVIAVLDAVWPGDRAPPLVTSFALEALAVVRAARPRLPVGLLWRSLPEDWLTSAQALDAATVHLDRRMVSPDTVAALASAGLPTLAYTVNDPAIARSLFDMGVTAVFSDAPDIVAPAASAGR